MDSQESLITFLVYGILFTVLLTTGLMLFFFYSRKRIVAEQLSKIELQLANQKNIIKTIIATQEEERKRIAQDMHDAISSKLNIVSLTTNVLLEEEDLSLENRASLEHILSVITGTLTSSRRIAHDLMPPVLGNFGLKVALEELIEDYARTKKLQIHHKIEEIPNLSKNENLHIFRIVQELINNAVRHGKASQITLNIENVSSGFSINFKDNGKGFIIENIDEISGIGLQNIESRAAILQAALTFESELGIGSTFNIISTTNEY